MSAAADRAQKNIVLRAPPKNSGPTQKKKKEKKEKSVNMSKGPIGITGRGGRGLSLFETTEICFGSTKMEISTGTFHTVKKHH